MSESSSSTLSRILLKWLLLLSLVPVCLVSVLSFSMFSRDMEESALNHLYDSSQYNERFINNWFDYRFMDIESLAHKEHNSDFLQLLSHSFQQSGKPLASYVGSYQWELIVHSNRADLANFMAQYDYIYDIFLIDTEGNILFTLVREPDLGTSLTSGPYASTRFAQTTRKVIETGDTLFSDMERYAPSNNIPAGFTIAPLLGDQGDRIGVIAVQLRLDRIFHQLESESFNHRGITHFIIGQDGELRSAYDQASNVLSAGDGSRDTTKLRQLFQASLDGPFSFNYTHPYGHDVLAQSHVLDIQGVKWLLVSQIEAPKLYAAVILLGWISLGLIAVTAVVVIYISRVQARRISAPLQRLSEQSKAIAEGHSTELPVSTTYQEVELLGRSFNQMIDTRNQHIHELERATAEAQQALVAKRSFLATMSHEIRTPMNGVMGMLGLLLTTPLNELQRHRAQVAQNSAKSLLTLINDILDFSKIEAEKLELELISFDLNQMLGEFIEAMAIQAQDKDLELMLDLREIEQAAVLGDPGRVRQILTNLVSNAIKFTAQGHVVIRASSKRLADDQVRLDFSVEDSGIGIPADKQELLFDSFSQVDASTTREYGGTGLGLAIAKLLSQLMGGDISVRSEEGKGSVFSFHLLLGVGEPKYITLPHTDFSQLSILVVDDNAINREILRGQLALWGAQVAEADSGGQALALCEQQYHSGEDAFFDIALLDMHMPSMDGLQLGRALKQDERFKSIQLIMMTSIHFRDDVHLFAEAGFSGYFAKPTTLSDLHRALSIIGSRDSNDSDQPMLTHNIVENLASTADSEHDYQWPDGCRILLVEDNAINQEVAIGLLEEMGLECSVAADGREALNHLKEAEASPYSLVIMDCQMPVMDGYEASTRIRAGEGGRSHEQIPIIALTANAMQGDREKCLEAGMSDYLPKPIDFDPLLAKLQRWLTTSHQQEPAPETVATPPMLETVIWDKADALRRLRGNTRQLNMLVELAQPEFNDALKKLQQALADQDRPLVRHWAHAIKGNAATLSGLRLQHIAEQLEHMALDSEWNQLMSTYQQLSMHLDELVMELQAYHATLSSQ